MKSRRWFVTRSGRESFPVSWCNGPEEIPLEPRVLAGADAVISLAGAPVGESRWTARVKTQIRDSRVQGTQTLVKAIGEIDTAKRPRHFISASAIGFYGDRGDEILTERSARGSGFLADVVNEWETEVSRVADHGVRFVAMRFGVVLGRGGGALAKMQPVMMGSGKQWMSWIHRDDLISMIEFALARVELSGAVNGVAPEPTRNIDFTRELARAKGWPGVLPLGVPAAALRVMLGEMSSLVLASQRVIPEVPLGMGFRFSFASLSDAFREILR